jgi:hypothetical protein
MSAPRVFEVEISGGENFLVNATGFTDAINAVNHYTVNHGYGVNDRQIEAVRQVKAHLIGLRGERPDSAGKRTRPYHLGLDTIAAVRGAEATTHPQLHEEEVMKAYRLIVRDLVDDAMGSVGRRRREDLPDGPSARP